MFIEYQIKRLDLVKAYFYNLRHSRRTQIIIFGIAALFALYSLFLSYSLSHGNLVIADFVRAFLLGIVFVFSIPVLGFLTAKTQHRTLSISQEGIETKIGSQAGKIPWQAVNSIVATEDRIFIVGKNANAFIIPASAFANTDLRIKFLELVSQYRDNPKN